MKKNLKNILIIILLFSLVYGIIISIIKMKQNSFTIKNHVNKIDSLKRDINEPQKIYQTLLIAYPNLSKYQEVIYYWSFIMWDQSKRKNIPWSLIAAKIWVESQFDPTLTNITSGAKGLAQLMEPTASALCDSLNMYYEINKTIWNDIQNVLLGIQYLKQGYDKTNSNRISAAKYYLAGPSWMNKKDPKIIVYMKSYSFDVVTESYKLETIYSGININKLY